MNPSCNSVKTRRAPNLIPDENERPGTTAWQLTRTRVDESTRWRCPWIEGYCSRTSVRAGETISIHVSTRPASSFTLEIFRLGWYRGAGGRRVADLGSFDGEPQPDPPVGPRRLRECTWEPAVELTIPDDWVSGVHVGKLTAEREGLQSYVVFVVRDDRECDYLFQCSDLTWAAYDRWPDSYSLYDDGEQFWNVGPTGLVSLDRPYSLYCQPKICDAPLALGSGEFLLWEYPLAFWMEEQGLDVSYVSNVDTHADGTGLLRAKAFLSVGHDEYWSLSMYDNVRTARDAGVSLGFFSGNSCWNVVPLHASSDGRPHRIMERLGEYLPPDAGEQRRRELGFELLGPDGARLMGARTTWPIVGGADWTCTDESCWIFEGTGMRDGHSIPGLVGWEWHGTPADIPGLRLVATGPTQHAGRGPGQYAATLYPGPRDNWVFNASTIWWSDGLAAPPGRVHPAAHGAVPRGPDARVQRMTRNLLDRFREGGREMDD